MILIKLGKAIIVRLVLCLHVFITVWRVTVDLNDESYWMLAILMVPFFIEALYTIIKRAGEDFRFFTPCFFFYLITTIPCIWLLELKKSDKFLDSENTAGLNTTATAVSAHNSTHNTTTVKPFFKLPDIGVDINPGTWTVLIEELLLYLMIVSRWLLPRGQVTRAQLSDLLFAFIGIASDIMEMFSLFGLEDVRKNRLLSYAVLGCWTISILQFCMTVTVIHEPRKGKVIKTIDDNDYEKEKPKIWNEILAICCSMVMQDIPFLALRLYTIVTYHIMNYSLVFFTAKNILVICLLLYKIAVLFQKRYCPEFLADDEDVENQITGDDTDKKNDGRFHHIEEEFSDSSRGSKEKQRMEQFYTNDKDSPTNSAFENDTPTQADNKSKLPMPVDSTKPNEKTPLKLRKADSLQHQGTEPSSPASSSNRSSARPSATPSAAPSINASNSSISGTSRNDSTVSTGYGWVSSKQKTDGK